MDELQRQRSGDDAGQAPCLDDRGDPLRAQPRSRSQLRQVPGSPGHRARARPPGADRAQLQAREARQARRRSRGQHPAPHQGRGGRSGPALGGGLRDRPDPSRHQCRHRCSHRAEERQRFADAPARHRLRRGRGHLASRLRDLARDGWCGTLSRPRAAADPQRLSRKLCGGQAPGRAARSLRRRRARLRQGAGWCPGGGAGRHALHAPPGRRACR